jgi:nucleotide-binding universal stress UspA family protein
MKALWSYEPPLFGSVTRQIVRESSVPVLIIKSGGLR